MCVCVCFGLVGRCLWGGVEEKYMYTVCYEEVAQLVEVVGLTSFI